MRIVRGHPGCRPRLVCTLLAAGLIWAATVPAPARAQKPMDQQQFLPRPPQLDRQSQIDLRRRLIELDKLITLNSVGRAEDLLRDLEQHSRLARELIPRRIKLAQLKGDYAAAVDLCRKGLAGQPRSAALWRSLGESWLATEQPDSARAALGRFISLSPNQSSATIVGVQLFQQHGRHEQAVALVDSMREALADPRFLARPRSISLLALGRQVSAAEEMVQELKVKPFNLSLLRVEVLDGGYQPAEHGVFLERLRELATGPQGRAVQRLLTANLMLAGGDAAGAREMVAPLLEAEGPVLALLQNAVALTREVRLMEDSEAVQATVDYLLEILTRAAQTDSASRELQIRAAETLAQVCETALDRGFLGVEPRVAVERFAEKLQLVRRIHPHTQHLHSSQIKLARYTRDVLADPETAARRLEGMLLDLDLPTEGVAVVRLTLGECYLAAGDTARGRVVLTRLGRDPEFREAAGHAHYHLARLDLAEGHFATARDRFAVVAMDNPAAAYANDSLDLGLAVAEEMENPGGGPDILGLYAGTVYFDLTAQPERHRAALEEFVREAELRLDPEEPQRLLERALFELGTAYAATTEHEEALDFFGRIVREHPDGRYAAAALQRQGEILAGTDRPGPARDTFELLLAQYPDYLFIDDVRDELRSLP